MAEIVQSLFGVSPEMYQRQQQDRIDAQALRFAQLDPFQQANFAIGRGANMLGGAIGGALGGQDPELQRITARQQIARQIDLTDPESIQSGMAMLQQAGDTVGLQQLAQIFRQQQESGALIAQRTAAAAESQAKAAAALQEKAPKPVVVGNALVDPASGREIYKGPDTKKVSGFAQELIDAGLTPGTEPFQKRMLEYVSGKVKGVSKGTGNVTIGGITVDTGAAAKAAGKIVGENVANVEQQYALGTAFKDALTLLDQGIYGGAYGPEKQFVAKFVGVGDPKKVENTEVFMANIGEIVIPRLQQFGGNDSNEELKYLQKVVAGDQRLEPAAMKRILASAEKKVQKNLARLQAQAAAGQTGAALPIGPMTPAATPTPTRRYNPQTRKIEAISGD
jgi:hypothetical protein